MLDLHLLQSTPPLHPMAFLSPGIGPYSPTLNSPSSYTNFNPLMNPAPGAPLQMTPTATLPYPPTHQQVTTGSGLANNGFATEPEYFPSVQPEAEQTSSLGLEDPAKTETAHGQNTNTLRSAGAGDDDVRYLRERIEGLVIPSDFGLPTSPGGGIRASFTMSNRPDGLSQGLVAERERRASMHDVVRPGDE